MNQRLAEVPIRVLNHIGKTSVFSEASYFYGVAPDESTDSLVSVFLLHETQVEKL